MVELQILNILLENKSFSILLDNNISGDYFIEYKEEYTYIYNHYIKYNSLPDRATLIEKFENFEFIEVNENVDFLISKLKEQYIYSKLVTVLNDSATLIQEDSIKTVEFLNAKVAELIPITLKRNIGIDIVKTAGERLVEYEKRKELKGLLGIPSGFSELDELTHGWVGSSDGELVSITARPNEGKSWLATYFGYIAWKNGKTVLMYSGEMSETMIGFRFDTFAEHYSNLGLIDGKEDLGNTAKSYVDYIKSLSSANTPFIIVTPQTLGGKRLDARILDMLIQKLNPDMIIIDQLSLMDDYRAKKGDSERIAFGNISMDLFNLSGKHKKPVLLDNQAKRKEGGKKGTEDDAPELDDIFGADAVGQNCTKVITLKQTSIGLKIAIKKNRYGLKNKEFVYFWDIDKGIFQKISGQATTNNEPNYEGDQQQKDYTEGTDLF